MLQSSAAVLERSSTYTSPGPSIRLIALLLQDLAEVLALDDLLDPLEDLVAGCQACSRAWVRSGDGHSQVSEGDEGDLLALAVLHEVRVAVGHLLGEEDVGVRGGGQVWCELPTRYAPEMSLRPGDSKTCP